MRFVSLRAEESLRTVFEGNTCVSLPSREGMVHRLSSSTTATVWNEK